MSYKVVSQSRSGRATSEDDYNTLSNISLGTTPQGAIKLFPEYAPYVGQWRQPYSSKVIPIFAQGTNDSAPFTGNNSYALMKLLDINLPYVKCNILRGEMSVVANNVYTNNTAYDSAVVSHMGETIYYQYPMYNAIEILIATKATFPNDNYTTGNYIISDSPRGGCWLKKVFPISWKLKTFTEQPFRNIDGSFLIDRQYWVPSGLMSSNDTTSDLFWNRYGNYAYSFIDTTGAYPHPETAVSSNWLLDYYIPNEYFDNDQKALEIIENDDTKQANIIINAITELADEPDHRHFCAKGLAKLI